LLILSISEGSAAVYYSKRLLFDHSTGYMESYVGRDWYRGSAVVARDSRLIYSCGHLFFDNGVWATDYEFYRAYNSNSPPDPANGASPRGFRYFTSYADNANAYGGDSSRAFAYDFTVFYGPNSFGPAVGYWADGGAVLRSSRQKRIVGYPANIEYTGASGRSYQYATDWFTNRGYSIRDAYHGFDKVSTGEGNSGGPVFVMNAAGDAYFLGGILVSGSYDTAGVYALNASSNSMASAALGLKSVTATFSNTDSILLPDAGTSYSTRTTTASGFSENITGLKCSVSITTPRSGDLNVYLKSPSGRVRWVHKASTSTADNLVVNQADYTTTFRGYAANGVWQLRMRDTLANNQATFNQFSVTVTAPGP
jgi:Proprotein convertase P-domain